MTGLHFEVLDSAQQQALEAANTALTPHRAVLAGGLSLALRYRHRRSCNMDWFHPADTDLRPLAEQL